MSKTLFGLYAEHVSNLATSLKKANSEGYDFIATPIVSPNFQRNLNDSAIRHRHIPFSRSDLILESHDWLNKIISVLSDYIDCDSSDEKFRKYSEKILEQELSFAAHLVQHGIVLLKLQNSNSINLARVISRDIKGTILVEVPMVNPKVLSDQWSNSSKATDLISSPWSPNAVNSESTAAVNSTESNETDVIKYEDPWEWWNTFRWYADFSARIFVALELSADLPSREEILRWLGEPVSALIIPSHIFIRNKQNYPVLSKAHQSVVSEFIKMNVGFLVKCSTEDPSRQNYVDYLKHLNNAKLKDDSMQLFADILEIPLQPLADNLDSYTYEVFEKDPIKYLYYQKAIELALMDKVQKSQIEQKKLIVMVVGAGRGPLVRASLNAAANTGRQIKIIVVEKNPNAINTLKSLVEEMWSDKDIEIISCDMREFTPSEKVDILVSELLGSFGDNELSPECLDGAQKHLKDDGISIPNKSTSYINPVMSSKVYNLVRTIEKRKTPRESCNYYTGQSESTYVIYLKNAYHIDRPQALFEFVHPNPDKVPDNRRFKTLRFKAAIDCVMHGFSGYFDTVLYKEIMLSIHPETHSKGMASWFSAFFPLTEPIQLKAGDTIEVSFWRCVSTRQVWYEWNVSSPIKTHIHNHNGRHCTILM